MIIHNSQGMLLTWQIFLCKLLGNCSVIGHAVWANTLQLNPHSLLEIAAALYN